MALPIKEQRARRGWTQSGLAAQLGVSQQAVSSWENGVSSPREDERARLEALLMGVDNTGQTINKRGIGKKSRPLLRILPTRDLSGYLFEEFMLDFIKLLYPDLDVERRGVRGDAQSGLDIVARRDGKIIMAFECKNVGQFGPQKVREVMGRVPDSLKVEDKCVILLGRPATLPAMEETRNGKSHNWTIWDAEAISHKIYFKIANKDQGQAVRLVGRYFPGMVENFLGVDYFNPWSLIEESFQSLPTGFVTHEQKLVGKSREDILKQIMKDVRDSDQQLVLLWGRRGLGKTRLSKEVALKMEKFGYEVRVMDNSVGLRPECFRLLPMSEQCLLIIDDAHTLSNITFVLRGINNVNSRAKVLLITDSANRQRLISRLQQEMGLSHESFAEHELKDLESSEAVTLIENVSDNLSKNLVRQIASKSYDCPLVGLLSVDLIRAGKLKEEDIAQVGEIRSLLLDRFQDAYISDPNQDRSYNQARLDVLRAIALLQPFNIRDHGLIDVALKITSLTNSDDFMRHIDKLLGTGVLLKRGPVLRIVPDLLGDFILQNAFYWENLGGSTGYIRLVCENIKPPYLKNALINAGRLDRPESSVGSGSDMLWGALRSEFKLADTEPARFMLFSLVKEVAYFQPRRTLDLIKLVMGKQLDMGLGSSKGASLTKIGRIRAMVPLILKNTAHNLEFLRESANLLWGIGKSWGPMSQNQADHPIKILQDLAGYNTNKPTSFNREMLIMCEHWLRADDGVGRHHIFSIMSKFLNTTIQDSIFKDNILTIRGVCVMPENFGSIRQKAVDLLLDEIKSGDPRRSIGALEVLCKSWFYSSYPPPDESDLKRIKSIWDPIFVVEMQSLYKVISDSDQDPLVFVVLRQYLHRRAKAKTDVGQSALRLLSLGPDSLLSNISLFLSSGDGYIFEYREEGGIDHEKSLKAQSQARKDCVQKALTEPIPDLVMLLEQRVKMQELSGLQGGQPQMIVFDMVKQEPGLGVAICDHTKSLPDSALSVVLTDVLAALVLQSPGIALKISKELMETGNDRLAFAVSGVLREIANCREVLSDLGQEVLIKCSKHESVAVRRQLMVAIRVLHDSNPKEAINMLMQIEIDADILVQAFCSVFKPYGAIGWSSLSPKQKDRAWLILKRAGSLDSFESRSFLEALLKEEPYGVTRLLMDRVDMAIEMEESGDNNEECSVLGYRPVPYFDQSEFDADPYPEQGEVLKGILSWIAQSINRNWRIRSMSAEIFSLAAGQYGPAAIQTIKEAIDSRDPDQFRAVCVVLGKAPRSLVFENVDSVAGLLRVAAELGEEELNQVMGSLYSAVVFGPKKGSFGKPFNEDLEQRDKSRAIIKNLGPGTPEHRFYGALIDNADHKHIRKQGKRQQ